MGDVHPVWYGSDSPARLGGAPSGVFMNAQVSLSATLILWYYFLSLLTLLFLQVVSITPDGSHMECKYIVDGIVETDVPLSRIKLASQPRDAVGSGFLSFLQDIVGRISALIPSRSDMHDQLNTALDLALLKQMVENNAMTAKDLVSVLSTLVSFIARLQSPHASSEFIAWFNPLALHCHSQATIDAVLIYLPKFFEVTSERLDQMQLEIANFYLGQLAPYAQAEGPAVFQNTVLVKIQEMIQKELAPGEQPPAVADEHYSKYLPRTTAYLCSQLQEDQSFQHIVTFLKEVQAIKPDEEHTELLSLGIGRATASGKTVDLALMARAFSRLLQQNVDLGSSEGRQLLPETFLWDGERLRNLKNEIDSLVLVTTLLISCRSYLLSVKTRLSVEQEVALQDMLYEVLRDASSVSLIAVVVTAQNFVRKNIHISSGSSGSSDVASSSSPGAGAGVLALPAGWETALEEALKKCILSTSPVFMLFSKRVHAILVKALLDTPFTADLGRSSMNTRPQIQQLKRIISSGKELFGHNSKTFGDVYSSILRVHCK